MRRGSKVAGAHFPSSLNRHAQTPIDAAAPTNFARMMPRTWLMAMPAADQTGRSLGQRSAGENLSRKLSPSLAHGSRLCSMSSSMPITVTLPHTRMHLDRRCGGRQPAFVAASCRRRPPPHTSGCLRRSGALVLNLTLLTNGLTRRPRAFSPRLCTQLALLHHGVLQSCDEPICRSRKEGDEGWQKGRRIAGHKRIDDLRPRQNLHEKERYEKCIAGDMHERSLASHFLKPRAMGGAATSCLVATADRHLCDASIQCARWEGRLRPQGAAGQPKRYQLPQAIPGLPWFTTCRHPYYVWQCRAAGQLCLWPNLLYRSEYPFWSR